MGENLEKEMKKNVQNFLQYWVLIPTFCKAQPSSTAK